MSRIPTVLAIALAVIAGCNSQSPLSTEAAPAPEEKFNAEVVAKLRDEGIQRSQVMDTVGYLTEVFGPRLTGSPNLKAAEEWAAKKLTEWGLENSHLEAWGPFGRGWTLEGFTANVVEPQFFRLIAYPRAWSPSTDGPVRGEVLYLVAKTDADLEKYKGKLNGAIVMISPPREVNVLFDEPSKRHTEESLLALANVDPKHRPERMTAEQQANAQMQHEMRIKKFQLCHSEGAAIILEGSGKYDGGTVFVKSAIVSPSLDIPYALRPRPWAKDAPPAIPQIDVAIEDYNRLVRMVERGIRSKVEVNIASKFHDDDLMSYNVVAEIPGTDLKDEIVMLGAHIDSVHFGTGATDNAAGSAVCMEAVRMLKALDLKPRRTIRIALWSGEEQYGLGSRAYVAEHFASWSESPRATHSQTGTTSGSGPLDAADGLGMSQDQRTPAAPKLELKPDHAKFAAYFNLDYGTGKIRGVYMQGNDAVEPVFRAWLAPLKDIGASTLSILGFGSDNGSFNDVGLPGFDFIQDPIEYETRTHHTNMDVYDRVQADDLKQAAVVMASFVYHTAMRDEKLPRQPPPSVSAFGF